jgi:hypothetical protein
MWRDGTWRTVVDVPGVDAIKSRAAVVPVAEALGAGRQAGGRAGGRGARQRAVRGGVGGRGGRRPRSPAGPAGAGAGRGARAPFPSSPCPPTRRPSATPRPAGRAQGGERARRAARRAPPTLGRGRVSAAARPPTPRPAAPRAPPGRGRPPAGDSSTPRRPQRDAPSAKTPRCHPDGWVRGGPPTPPPRPRSRPPPPAPRRRSRPPRAAHLLGGGGARQGQRQADQGEGGESATHGDRRDLITGSGHAIGGRGRG